MPSPARTPTSDPTATITISALGTIAFTSQRNDGMPELYMMGADGSQQTRLTHDLQNNSNLLWSPNGRFIAFETMLIDDGDVANQIRLIDSDGTGLRALTPEHGTFTFPSWSPDSKAIVFASEDGDIHLASIDGGPITNLTNSPSKDISPQWAPDGSTIFYVSDADGHFNVYTMKPDGTHQARLTDLLGEAEYRIYLSPDGTKLALVQLDEHYDSALYVLNSDGSQLTLLAGEPPYNNEPSWSPSSDAIAFVSGPYDRLNVYVVKIDGQGPSQLTHDTWSSDPAWSPDGTRIAYSSDSDPTDDYNFEIYLMNADGSQQTRLTGVFDIDTGPAWRP